MEDVLSEKVNFQRSVVFFTGAGSHRRTESVWEGQVQAVSEKGLTSL